MNIAAIDARTSLLREPCIAAVWTKRAASAVFRLCVAGLEAWLRAPVQPVLDAYLGTMLSRASSISAAIFRHLSF
ncbi:hypothetical protein [Caballeronia sordidicola]|jgi:hypothetical protein|uniref:Uncharacterized protein n=1 Tax=Caballeronia sordidicola TaxID=196367 RepID=A0A226WR83_CABSO|nr:hypothetical protein [Caballeronia sordidicola]OXC73695.1 hypothetical protein BSU04_36490 [Caballeronia sordidicola]